jgi:hypothetical protein
MQLRQMQDQSAIQQQQAAIQQQQAQFAQQKQPLELQQIQAGIAAQQAAAAHSGAATGLLGVQTQAAKSALEESQRKDQAVAAYQSEALKLSEDPTSWDVNNLKKLAMQAAALNQPGFDGMNSLLKALPQTANILSNAASEVLLSVNAGKPAIAKASLENYIAGVQAVLDKNPEDKSAQASLTFLNGAKTTLENDPTGANAALQASNYLFNTDPVKAEAVAKALRGTAETAEIEARTKVELSKLPKPGQMQLSDKQQSDVNALTTEAASIRTNVDGLTSSVDSLLKFAEQKPNEFKSGAEARLQDFASWISGNTTEAQNARSAVQLFTNKDWIAKANGLKGSLSDKEGARLDKGAPNAMSAGPAEILNWMRLVQKVELADADEKDLSAAWQANSKSLQSKAQSGFEVAGLTVKPGDTFSQTLTKLRAQYRKKGIEDIQTDAARLKNIKQAKDTAPSLVPNMYNMSGAPQQPAAGPNQVTGTSDRQSLLNKYR